MQRRFQNNHAHASRRRHAAQAARRRRQRLGLARVPAGQRVDFEKFRKRPPDAGPHATVVASRAGPSSSSQASRRERVAPFTVAAFAITLLAISAALLHAPRVGLHPHILALAKTGSARSAGAPPQIVVSELGLQEARSRQEMPQVGDLTVLKPSQEASYARQAASAPNAAIKSENGSPAASLQAASKGTDVQALTKAGEAVSQEPGTLVTSPARLPPLSLAPLDGSITALERSYESLGQRDRLCEVDTAAAPTALLQTPAPSVEFGRALAAAAMRQTGDFVVYTDKYRRMAYPMGDVPAMFGVCTDVIIRAYRAVGIDLQARIHAARIGSGDRSIAHRRTFTLRRYFASRGASVPISSFVEDYLPGDIVTYDRPQNRGSRDHIAIVTDVIAPSGRPMIVHNRGWGPQLEDALFVDRITGHYRYRGQTEAHSSKSGAGENITGHITRSRGPVSR